MKKRIKVNKLIARLIPVALIIATVFSACTKKNTEVSDPINADGQLVDADGYIINDEGELLDPNDPNAWLFEKPRPEFDWRQNVYSEYALDFKLGDNEPYHIFDINSVDGKVIAVAKLNTETDDTLDNVDYSLALIDNDKPDELTLLDIPTEISGFGTNVGGTIIDAGYSGVRLCKDGSVIGVYYGTVCRVNESGELEMTGIRYLTHWNFSGEIITNTDISAYLDKEYGFVKYTNLLSNGSIAVFTECDKIYGFLIDTAGNITSGREITTNDGLYYVSDIETDSEGRDIVFYSYYYSGKISVVDVADDTDDSHNASDNNTSESVNASEDSADTEEEYDREERLFVDAALLNPDTLMLEDSVVIPYEIRKNDYYSINRGYNKDFVYSNENGVYSFDIGDEEVTPVMNYANSDFRGYFFTDIATISANNFIGIFTTYDEGIMLVAGFEEVPKATLDSIETIKLGVYGQDNSLRKIVREYNNSKQGYRIILEDYSKLEVADLSLEDAESIIVNERLKEKEEGFAGEITVTEADYTEYVGLLQLAQLRQDILDRTGPDLLMINPNKFDFDELGKKGLLVDFDELAKNDVELSGANGDMLYDAYLMNAMDAYAIDGKHYLYLYDFYYNIYTGRNSGNVLPSNNNGWSIIDFDITYNQYHVGGSSLNSYDLTNAPVLIAYKTRTQFIDIMLKYDGSEFVDTGNDTCTFDSEDFVSLLKYAGSLPAQNNDNLAVYQDISVSYRNDSVLISENILGMGTPEGFWSDMCRNFDGDYCCIGFPSRNGEESMSGAISIAELPIAIISNGNVDGAWDFAREFYCDDYQNSIVERGAGIPVLSDAFENWLSEGMNRSAGLYYTDASGNSVFAPNTYIAGGQNYTVPYMMDDDVVAIKNSILNCKKQEFTDAEIIRIVKEETNIYFAGGITAEETAANIQERVLEYLK